MSPNESPHRSSSARPGTMKAARVHQWGSPEVITVESVDLPEPADEELLVRVHAAGVGPWDALVRSGKIGLPLTLPLTLGSEVSGAVEKVGAKTTGFAVGDEVFGATNPRFIDGYAEYAVAAARMIAPKPRELSHIEAASVPVVAVTAWQMLFDHAKVQEGQTVVVHGGGGNVGAYVVQLARASRLHVIATIHGDDADYVRSLGAHEVVDTKSEEFQAQGFVNFARRADAVIDTVGGKTQAQLFPLVKPGGVIVSAVVRPDTQRAAALYDKPNLDLIRDIAPVAGVFRGALVIVVHPSVPARSVPEFIAYAKANPRKLNMASSGTGAVSHIAGELFKMMAGIDMVHVPYRGGGPAVTDLLGGQVQVYFASTPASIEYIKAGRLRALALTTATRSEALPDIPTVAEFVPGYEASYWAGIGAPKGTPAEIVEKLNKEINAALADPTMKARVADLGGDVLALSPTDFGKIIADETEKWGKVIRTANIKAE